MRSWTRRCWRRGAAYLGLRGGGGRRQPRDSWRHRGLSVRSPARVSLMRVVPKWVVMKGVACLSRGASKLELALIFDWSLEALLPQPRPEPRQAVSSLTT